MSVETLTVVSPRRHLTLLAKEQDIPVIQLVTDAIREHNSVLGAAQALDVSPGAIHYHLKRNRLRVVTRMVAVVVPEDEG